MYEEMEKVEIMDEEVFVEEETAERENFGAKIKRHWSNFVNDPVSGGKKVGLVIGALLLGGVMERHHSRKDKQLLDEEVTLYKSDRFGNSTNEAVKMSKRELLNGIDKTHSVNIEPIEKMETYKEFKKKKS